MLDLVGPVVFWLAAAFKARRITEPGQRPLALALLALAIGLTLDIPSVYVAFDRAVGVPNLANLVEHSFALLGVFLVLTFLEQVTGRPTWTWARSFAIAAVLVAVSALFLLASPRPEASDFTRTFDDLALIEAYWIVTIGYFGLCLAALLRLAIGHARQAGRREVRIGFAAVGVGVIVGVVYSALKIAELLITGDTTVLELLDGIALALGATLIGGGFLYPLAASSLSDVRRQVRARRLLLQLRPAWREAIARRPGVVARPPAAVCRRSRRPGRHVPPLPPSHRGPGRRSRVRQGGRSLRQCPARRRRVGLARPRRWCGQSVTPERRLRVAKLVSDVLGPVPMGVVLAIAVGIHSGRGVLAGAGWGLLSVTCAAVLPAVATAPLRRRHPRTRAIRLGYMSLATAGAVIGLVVLWLLPAPSDIEVLAAGFAAGLVCSASVNVIYASSNHAAALAGGTVLSATLLSPWLLLAGGAAIIGAWARVALKAHTPGQAVAGSIVGLLSAAAIVAATAWPSN